MAATPEPKPTLESLEQDERLAKLLAGLMDQAQRKEEVDIQQVCNENPDIAEELRQLWAMVVVTEVAADQPTIDFNKTELIEVETLELPCQFGDYEILEELGRGGMGIVYRARQLSLNREVALKMILRGSLASAQDRRRFFAEAEAAAQLEHPGIVPVYEVGQHQGLAFFSMKVVEGQTLDQLLANRPIDARKAAEILKKIAEAIHYAHERGVLHRDLKPSNILIDQNGNPNVTDFGLAKRFTEKNAESKSGIVGTPMYMAPEQAEGAKNQVGPGTDVYCMGNVLYFMLTGRPPFQAATPLDTMRLVLEQDPAPPRVINRTADRSLELVALKCLQKPVELRYETAQELANDLGAFLNSERLSIMGGRFGQIIAGMFRETHHASILEMWGVLWMWHSLVLLIACFSTNIMHIYDIDDWNPVLWTVGFWTWAAVFWMLRRRMGPVTFIERQIAHVWGACLIGIALLFPIERILDLPDLSLSPIVAVFAGFVFVVKAGMLSGSFYIQSVALFATSMLMLQFPDYGHFIFGVVSAACFFFPGLKYYRQSLQRTGKSA